jgi:hypothetical protein
MNTESVQEEKPEPIPNHQVVRPVPDPRRVEFINRHEKRAAIASQKKRTKKRGG